MENYYQYKDTLVEAIEEATAPSSSKSQKKRNMQIKTIYKVHDRAASLNKYPESSVKKSYQDHLKSQNKAEKDWHEAGTNKDKSKQAELNSKAASSERHSDEKYRQYWVKYNQNKKANAQRDKNVRQDVKNLPKNEEVEYEEVEVEPVFLMSENEELTEENTAFLIEDEDIEEIEVEPIFMISEDEIMTEENTAVIIEDEELNEALMERMSKLAADEKLANFQGHQVVVNKNTGVIQSGKFKGKKVNLVKDRQRNIKKIYKDEDDAHDKFFHYSDSDYRDIKRDYIREKNRGSKAIADHLKGYHDNSKEYDKYHDKEKRQLVKNQVAKLK